MDVVVSKRVEDGPPLHAGLLNCSVRDNVWQERWCVLRQTAVDFFVDSSCRERVGHLELTPSAQAVSSQSADSASRAHLLHRHFGFVLDADTEAGQSMRNLVYADAGDQSNLEKWTAAVNSAVQALADLSRGGGADEVDCLEIDDFSDYEEENCSKRTSIKARFGADWTAISNPAPPLQVSAEPASTEQFHVDDLSDYEDDTKAKRSSLYALDEKDWTSLADRKVSETEPIDETF
eukprot:TRINITY_DN40283_c0_g1_i1.p1 TRINITY_DN40283_c0_g1~~TRINITY_DN40283_c0_g1_i1.p1  ORF type:complete len:235 (-),score=53.96 TRINITY_DN40283_c0_g1_i1:17-721(-)